MGPVTVDQIQVAQLKRIPVEGGDVLHALRSTDIGFRQFGEAYFSMVDNGAIKAWKLHRRMTLNLVVPVGVVKFVFYAEHSRVPREEVIGEGNYVRLTVPPGLWFGFQGRMAPYSLILNIVDIAHEPDEVERKSLSAFDYKWREDI